RILTFKSAGQEVGVSPLLGPPLQKQTESKKCIAISQKMRKSRKIEKMYGQPTKRMPLGAR
ncbi:MAG: hypothetical protein Q3963_03915, partial [Coriobacteriaceae bacterium]|nr:hypothetical protein [Coriobacteriaceae bacterium]